MNNDQVFILNAGDADAIKQFEGALQAEGVGDILDREMASWHARWRPEALEFYLPLGWSFGFRRDSELAGYLLAQPLLFFRGLTQTLWVEHVAFASVEIGQQLIDTAHRWAKDKRLQTVLFSEAEPLQAALKQFPAHSLLNDRIAEMKSAKF